MAQSFAHLREEQFWLVAQAEKRFRTAQYLSGAGDGENLVGSHSVRPRISRIAAEGAVSAVVTAEIGQRQEDLTRVSNDAGFEAFLGGTRGGEKLGKVVVRTAD